MANYRPKSLNELNNIYDKSMAAQNAIKKNGSAIVADSDKKRKTDGHIQQEVTAKEKVSSQIASDELSSALSGLIKKFCETETAKEKPVVRQPLPITKTIKPSAKKSSTEDKSEASDFQSEQSEKKEKPVLMRNAERTELLDDYMKIMNDDDDDVAYLKDIIKKKKKSKKEKHQVSLTSDNETEESEDPSVEKDDASPEAEEVVVMAAVPEAEEETESKEEPEFPSDEEEEEQKDEESPQRNKPTKKKKIRKKREKNFFLQIFFMLLLLAVLISAITLSTIKIVTNAENNDPIMDKYSLFTIDRDFEKAELSEGDLVITENKAVAENDSFAYKNPNGEIIFAVKGTQIGTNRFMAHYDGQVDLIEEISVRGVIIKTIPGIGNIVKILTDNFIIIISVLIAVALIIILILALAFSSKSNYEIDDSEYSDSPDETTDDETHSDNQDVIDEETSEEYEEFSSETDEYYSSDNSEEDFVEDAEREPSDTEEEDYSGFSEQSNLFETID